MACLTLPYPTNSADVFARIADWPLAIFLDSGQMPDQYRQFDIFSAAPPQWLRLQDNQVWHADTQSQRRLEGTVFDAIKQAVVDVDPVNDAPKHLPFTVGALGYVGYDAGRQLESLPSHRICDLTLPDAVVGVYDWSVVIDHTKHSAWLVSSLPTKHPRLQQVYNRLTQSQSVTKDFLLQQPFKACIDQAAYQNAFQQLKHHIQMGDCYQANLCQRFQTTYQGSPFAAYYHLRQHHASPFSGFFHTPWGDILSHSPERFLKIQQRQVMTQPIKGTAARDHQQPQRDRELADALQRSEKNRAENCMIVDLLRNDLARTCDDVKVPALCECHSFPNVHHLISTVTATQQPGVHSLDTLKTCFPGGSITGAPKIRAMEIIADLEPYHRSAYCGSFFYCDTQGHLDSNILIRTLLCVDQTITAYAGGGIVHDSEVNSEYQETLTKIQRLLHLLESSFLTQDKELPC